MPSLSHGLSSSSWTEIRGMTSPAHGDDQSSRVSLDLGSSLFMCIVLYLQLTVSYDCSARAENLLFGSQIFLFAITSGYS